MPTAVAYVISSTVGSAGALGVDIALGALPIPDQFKTGPMRTVARVGAAFGLGYVAGLVKPSLRTPVLLGALTMVAYSTMRDLASRFAPQLPGLSEYPDYQVGYIDPAPQLASVGAYMEPAAGTMGAYMQPSELNGYESSDGM